MKKVRTILGFLLIIIASSGLIFWEIKGRESIMMDTVIVATETIPAGSVISRDHLSPAGVPAESKIYRAIDWDSYKNIIGKVTKQGIVKNGQLSEEYLINNDFYIKEHQSIFVIPSEWIQMRSSSIRRGDWVDIYESADHEKIGTYKVAFVKDGNEIEVSNGENNGATNLLERTTSTSQISHIEIITDLEEYKKIDNYAKEGEVGLLLVQREVYGK